MTLYNQNLSYGSESLLTLQALSRSSAEQEG
jgi:hypothetical protein